MFAKATPLARCLAAFVVCSVSFSGWAETLEELKQLADQGVHLFILSGQSNMVRMKPETGFMTEANKLFGDEKVVFIKVAKGGQPICRWLQE